MKLDALRLIAALSFGLSTAGLAGAATVLTDANSRVTVDDRNGMTVWRVNNTADNVFLSNYYLRVGSTGKELPLSEALGAPKATSIGSNTVSLAYENASMRAVVTYALTGGAAGVFESSVATSVSLTNLGDAALDVHLFQYSDFDLKFDQASQRDQILYLSRSSLLQFRDGTPYVLHASVGVEPTHYQATDDFFDFYSRFFVDNDGPTTLNDTPGIGARFPNPAKDSAFAFQWDRELAPRGSFEVDARFRLAAVPEPSGVALAAPIVAAAVFARRRRNRPTPR